MALSLKDILDRIDDIHDPISLARHETDFNRAQDDPFSGDALPSEGDVARVRAAYEARHRLVSVRKDMDDEALTRDSIARMLDFLENDAKDAGAPVTHRVGSRTSKGGKRYAARTPVAGGKAFAGEARGGDDSGVKSGRDEFLEIVSDFLGESYDVAGRGRPMAGTDLVGKEHTIPADALSKAQAVLLTHMGESGYADAAGLTARASKWGLPKSALADAKRALKARQAADPEAQADKAQRQAASKIVDQIVGHASREARKMAAPVIRGLILSPANAARLAELRGGGPGGGGSGGGSGGDPGGEGADADEPQDAESVSKRQARREIEEKYAQSLKDRGRGGEVGGAGYHEVLYKQFERKGINDASSTARINRVRAAKQAREAREARARQARFAAGAKQAAGAAKAEEAAGKKESAEEARHRRYAEDTLDGAEQAQKKRDAANFRRNAKADEDAKKTKGAGGAGFDLYKGSMLVGAFASSVRNGLQLGNAAGAVASGLERAVLGAASGFVRAGEGALALFLSPFGRSGAALSGVASALGGALLGVLSAGGGLAVAGVRLGVSLGGALIGGASAAVGAGLGALAGTLLGVGPLAGAVAGAGVVAAVGGALTSVLSSVGGALGQALGAIGTAFGQVGASIGDALGRVQGVLSDLIETGSRFAQATLTVARTGNVSLGAAGGVASLASIVTGSPGGLDGVFAGFGAMSQYRGFALRAFGVAGATGTDPLGDFGRAGAAYAGMDPIRREILLRGGFAGNAAVGNLFALNAQPGGAGLVDYAVATARKTALTPREAVADAKLALDLSAAQAQMDRLKLSLLTDLMPTITKVLGVFTHWFTQNQGKIVAGLQGVGEWMYVKLPTYVHKGLDALMEFGEAMLGMTPLLVGGFRSAYAGLATFINLLANGIPGAVAGMLNALGPLGAGLASQIRLPGQILDPNALDDPNSPAGKALLGLMKGAEAGRNGLITAQERVDAGYQKNFGSEAQWQKDYDGFRQYVKGPQRIEISGKLQVETKHDIDLNRLRHTMTDHLGEQMIQAVQRSN